MHACDQPHEQREAESSLAKQVINQPCDGKEKRAPEKELGPELATILRPTGDERLQPAKGDRRPIRTCDEQDRRATSSQQPDPGAAARLFQCNFRQQDWHSRNEAAVDEEPENNRDDQPFAGPEEKLSSGSQ